MSNIIKIGTLNAHNDEINRMGGIRNDGVDNTKLLADYINESGFYVLGTQELSRKFSKSLLNKLSNYKLYGGYRYAGRVLKLLPILGKYNENNAIITNQNVLTTQTYSLPWIPRKLRNLFKAITKRTIKPRIVTKTKIKDTRFGILYIVNTHLDYQDRTIQTRQTDYIIRFITPLLKKYPVIITGDFNMEINHPVFKKFISNLNNLGLKRIEVSTKTNAKKYANKTAIDHIFIPKKWEVQEAGIVKNEILDQVTDHKLVYAIVKICK